MFCASCGTQVPDGTVICPNCHNQTGYAELHSQQTTSYNQEEKNQQLNQNMNNTNYSMPHFQMPHQQPEARIKDVKEIFVREDEQQKAVIGGGYLNNLIHSGELSKGFGILTNRRFYFRGKCYHRNDKGFIKTDEERVVDLQDITSSGFVYTRNILWLVLGIFGIIWTLILAAYSEGEGPIFKAGVLPDIIFWIIYFFSKFVLYEVSFAGGNIAVKASSYGTNELKEFDKKLRLAKDEFLEAREK